MQNNTIVYGIGAVIVVGVLGFLVLKPVAPTPIPEVVPAHMETTVQVPVTPTTSAATATAPAQSAPKVTEPAAPVPVKPVVKKPPVSTSANASVTIDNYNFSPPTLTVKKGTTVVWVNHDIAKHTITADSGAFTSEFFGKGEKYTHVFNEVGTFAYHCEPHPYMHGTVVVTD